MRQVAVALKIDLNTVQRAYAELERDGVLTKLRGVGTFVTDNAPPPPRNCPPQARRNSPSRIAGQAKGQGIALEELAEALARLAERDHEPMPFSSCVVACSRLHGRDGRSRKAQKQTSTGAAAPGARRA